MWPIIYESSSFTIYSYPLFWGLAWGLGLQAVWDFFKSKDISFLQTTLWMLGVFFSSWIGAKSLFLVTQPSSLDIISESRFWYGGGFVFLGGLFGGLLFIYLFSFYQRKLQLSNLGPVTMVLILCHALGRIGCFVAGCCYGEITDSLLGVHIHHEYRYPTQIFEAIFLVILWFTLRRFKKSDFTQFYFIAYGFFRFFLEYFRGDLVRGKWGILTPSQWMSLALISLGFLILTMKSKKNSQVIR